MYIPIDAHQFLAASRIIVHLERSDIGLVLNIVSIMGRTKNTIRRIDGRLDKASQSPVDNSVAVPAHATSSLQSPLPAVDVDDQYTARDDALSRRSTSGLSANASVMAGCNESIARSSGTNEHILAQSGRCGQILTPESNSESGRLDEGNSSRAASSTALNGLPSMYQLLDMEEEEPAGRPVVPGGLPAVTRALPRITAVGTAVVIDRSAGFWKGLKMTSEDLVRPFHCDPRWRFDLPTCFLDRDVTPHEHSMGKGLRKRSISFPSRQSDDVTITVLSSKDGQVEVYSKQTRQHKRTKICAFRLALGHVEPYVVHERGSKLSVIDRPTRDAVLGEFADGIICFIRPFIEEIDLATFGNNLEWRTLIIKSLFEYASDSTNDRPDDLTETNRATRFSFQPSLNDRLDALSAHAATIQKAGKFKDEPAVIVDRENPAGLLDAIWKSPKLLMRIKIKIRGDTGMETAGLNQSMCSHFREINSLFWERCCLLPGTLPPEEAGRVVTLFIDRWSESTQRLVNVGRLILHCLVNGYACTGLNMLIIYFLLLREVPLMSVADSSADSSAASSRTVQTVDVEQLVAEIPNQIIMDSTNSEKMQGLHRYINNGIEDGDDSFMDGFRESGMETVEARRRCVFNMLRHELCANRLNGLLAMRHGFRSTVPSLVSNLNLFSCDDLAQILGVSDITYADLKGKMRYKGDSESISKFEEVLRRWDGTRMLYMFWRLVTGGNTLLAVKEISVDFERECGRMLRVQTCFNTVHIGPRLFNRTIGEIAEFFEAHALGDVGFEYD